ncbi:threonine synthase [Candidatus Woesearchaeota archaeon]|nr:threonine synthase [Candidatus Woesearchaeota archaeon]
MLLKDMPNDVRDRIIPVARPLDSVMYECITCGKNYPLTQLLYTCPDDKGLLNVRNNTFDELRQQDPDMLKKIFSLRKSLDDPTIINDQALHGVFRWQELVMPAVGLEDVVYLGEANTPVIAANPFMNEYVGTTFQLKHDGIEPSVSFKDRGMASAVSFLNYLYNNGHLKGFLGICASTGDTSASATLYLSALTHNEGIHSAVLLPKGKVTPAQLSQPLAAGAQVLEVPGVFDDCMDVVQELAANYDVALLNSKNGLRILGQKTFAYETAERFAYDMKDKVIVVPIGNAGNVTSVLSGFLDLYELNMIDTLPKIVGVQSENADPVVTWYETDKFEKVDVTQTGPSTAQAAYIGNPVSFPRVEKLTQEYRSKGGNLHAVRVNEQEIMDNMLLANRNGLTVCTQGGEAIAGLKAAVEKGYVSGTEIAMVDSTSHQIKFAGFQMDYYSDKLRNPSDPGRNYGVIPKKEYVNLPQTVQKDVTAVAQTLGLTK